MGEDNKKVTLCLKNSSYHELMVKNVKQARIKHFLLDTYIILTLVESRHKCILGN